MSGAWRDTFGLDNYIAGQMATEHARRRVRKERDSKSWWSRKRALTRRDFFINASRNALGRKKQLPLTAGDRTYFAIERVSLDCWQLTIRRGPFDYVQLTGTLGECNRARLPLVMFGIIGVVTDIATALKLGPQKIVTAVKRDGARPRLVVGEVGDEL